MSERVLNDLFEPAPPPEAVNDIHRPEFWAHDTANINQVFARYQALATNEAGIEDLRAFTAETICLVLHQRRILRQICLDTAPKPKKPRRPYTRKPKLTEEAFS